MAHEFTLTRRVEFSETDMAGIVHFSNFFRFMESAEHAFFRSLGFSVAGSRDGLEGVSLASVVPPLTMRVVQACHEYLKQEPLVVDTGVKTGIKIRYEDPRAVGADRICDAVAVMKMYGGPACVVDFGTATTFNAITKDGEYLGGAITAGINLQLLYDKTVSTRRQLAGRCPLARFAKRQAV